MDQLEQSDAMTKNSHVIFPDVFSFLSSSLLSINGRR